MIWCWRKIRVETGGNFHCLNTDRHLCWHTRIYHQAHHLLRTQRNAAPKDKVLVVTSSALTTLQQHYCDLKSDCDIILQREVFQQRDCIWMQHFEGEFEAKSRHSVSDVNERRGGFKSLFPPWQALSSGISEEGTSVHSLSIFRRNLWQHCEILCYHSGVAQCSKCSRDVTLCRCVNSSRGFGGICTFFRYGD